MLRDNTSDSPSRVGHVSLAAWDQVTVSVTDGLAGDLAAIPPDVEPFSAICEQLSTEFLEGLVRTGKAVTHVHT